ncbi:C3 and PZP-like alpha-2-macroglobulin domain-containing protein 8 [Mercenaria mercenaria]|uniref:C3 and PZP-like alpha-2-macroglobulin domain-containing protein 8 n=1 Tax=Mercenaria mercenaria TaxID=6596 RepID=UPI00234EEFAF|nr:C3 and PZP-like alpha-2-macroglobulin domain-containing protein 8 [Mercenaria mercenaria]
MALKVAYILFQTQNIYVYNFASRGLRGRVVKVDEKKLKAKILFATQNCAKTCGLCSNTGLKQVQHTRDSFPETWIWTNFTVGSNGTGTLTTTVPDTITSWYATAFSVNTLSGLGITDGASKFTTFRPFFINLNLPYSVVRGEEVVIQANVFNYMGQDLDVVVTLEKSSDFKVIVHDAPGHTIFVSKDITQTIHIEAGQAKSIFVPVVANIVGVAEIAVKAQTVLSADRVKKELIVEAEGTPMHFNIPLILNENTAVDVPLSFPPSFVADSQKIQVSAIGDTMGPTVKNLKRLLRMPTGCGEQTITNLAPDVFVYNYLKKTNKLTSDIESMTLEYMLKGYQRELTFQRTDGSFSIWGESDNQGSMWLTAFVLKSFHQAREHIFVSDDVLQRAGSWILRYQNYDGSFPSVGSVHSTSLRGGSSSGYSLTAFVLIALTEAEMTLRYSNYNYNNGITKARVYLENAVINNNITDIYDLAIVSYALSKSGSAKAFLTYKQLKNLATRTGDGKMFWNMTKTWRQSSWEYSYYQSPPLEVEVASYALLYLVHSGQIQTGYPVLRWLVSQRNSLGGFRSTQDTVLGLQAMSEYGAMFKDAVDLTIDITSGNFSKQIHIGKSEAMVLKLVDIPHSAISRSNNSGNHPPTVSLQAHGNGSALVQVAVSFNVETEVSLPAFNITATIVKETLRSVILNACARYLPQRFNGPGMAVMEIDLPSGFSADLESSNTKVGNARQTEIREEKTVVLYYDQILPSYPETCATIEMIRTDLVTKTKPAAIRVFDYYEPDNRALSFFESKLLKDSSFCDICNSCGCS